MTEWASAIEGVTSAAGRGELVVFVGTGPSTEAPAHLPDWPGLLERMATILDDRQPTRAAVLREEAAAGNYLKAADEFSNCAKLTKRERLDFVCSVFDLKKDALPPVYKLIASLPAAHWITTNFDPLLHFALQDQAPEVQALTNTDEALNSLLSLWSDKRFLLHLHGRAFESETLVLDSDSFRRLAERTRYRHLMERVFCNATVLFYGYSCADPDVREILRFVAEELSGATRSSHYLLSSSQGVAQDGLLHAANVNVVRYSAENGHSAAKEFLREVASRTRHPGAPAVLPTERAEELRSLAALFLAISGSHDRESSYAAASAAVIQGVATSETLLQTDLISRIAHFVHVPISTAARMMQSGLALLERKGLACRDGDQVLVEALKGVQEAHAPFVDAVELRLRSHYSLYRSTDTSRVAIKGCVSHVMLAQGLTVARSFVNEDNVRAYDLEALVREAVRAAANVSAEISAPLTQSICEIVREPDPQSAQALFGLAHAAYALENLFLNPVDRPLATTLHWKIFLDSNIVLRLLSPAARQGASFRELVDRLRRLGVPLALLWPFLEECVEHAQGAGRVLKAVGVRDESGLRDYLATLRRDEWSPVVEWFLGDVVSSGWKPFSTFLEESDLASTAKLASRLSRLGITCEEPTVRRVVDTSERETLWAELREWRRDQSSKGRTLRRNEASQVEWMVRLRADGTRAWFLSIDGQLRRALVSLRRGFYAGFVMTPTALAHSLTELRWGDVDLSGFTAMMWTLPSRTPVQRAEDLLMRQLLERADLSDLDADWLRDRVENEISRNGVVVLLASGEPAGPDEGQEADFVSTLQAIMPKSVDRLLDEIARKRQADRDSRSRRS